MRSALHAVHHRPVVRLAIALAAVAAMTVGLAGTGSAGATPDPAESPVIDTSISADPGAATADDSFTVSGIEPGFSAGKRPDAGRVAQEQFEVLQFNLCHSGYNNDCPPEGGDPIAQAQAYILYLAPRTVTLNEICVDDIEPLHEAFRDGWRRRSWEPSWWTFWAYRQIYDKDGEPIICETSDSPYVVAVLGYVPDSEYTGVEALSGVYPDDYQAPDDERRVWLCATAGGYISCTTHLTNDDDDLAYQQCLELGYWRIPDEVLPGLGNLPATIGGDFNLLYVPLGEYNVHSCRPDGWYRKGDGDVQHVMFSGDFSPAGRSIVLDMHGTTDHPALLVPMTAN